MFQESHIFHGQKAINARPECWPCKTPPQPAEQHRLSLGIKWLVADV